MRNLIRILVIILIMSCSSSEGTGEERKSQEVIEVKLNDIEFKDSIQMKNIKIENELINPLESLSVEELSKQILQGDMGNVMDSEPTFSLIDSLYSKDPQKKLHWFHTNSILAKYSDGALSELMSIIAYEYIYSDPVEFIDKLITLDSVIPIGENLETWANMIKYEAENDEFLIIKKLDTVKMGEYSSPLMQQLLIGFSYELKSYQIKSP